MAELKPCPACGSKIATPVLEYDGKFPQLGYVRCREITCGLKTGLFADGGRHAVEIWNSIPRTDDVRGVAFWVDTQPHLDDSSYKKDNMAYYCSNCHHRAGKYKHRSYKFCPWCGARIVPKDTAIADMLPPLQNGEDKADLIEQMERFQEYAKGGSK